MSFTIVSEEDKTHKAKITVFGVGGGGGNAIQHMLFSNIEGVKFVCANTDRQALDGIETENKILLGEECCGGLGAGANPDLGKQAAEESIEEIAAYLKDTDMVFITAGMGGGTGTGAAPVIAKMAKDMKILTVAVVTTPFTFEGKRRSELAEKGIAALEESVDSLIVIPNQRLLKVFKGISMKEAYKNVDDILLSGVRNIFDLIIRAGYINLDFADLKAAMSDSGYAMMGVGIGRGENRAVEAAEQAIRSPLLEGVTSMNAKSLVINIASKGNEDVSLDEVEIITGIVNHITELDESNIFFGTAVDPELDDAIRVSVVATGLVRNIDENVYRGTRVNVGRVEGETTVTDSETTDAIEAAIVEQTSTTTTTATPEPSRAKSGFSLKDLFK